MTARAVPMKGVIKSLCKASFSAQMQIAKLPPNTELGNYACNCFVRKIEEGNSIKEAKRICKHDSKFKFKLLKP